MRAGRRADDLVGLVNDALPDGLDTFLEFTAGDRTAALQLRRAIDVLAHEYADQPLGRQARAVLDGRASFRDLAGDPELASMATQAVRGYAEERAAMSPEERERLAHQAAEAEKLANDS